MVSGSGRTKSTGAPPCSVPVTVRSGWATPSNHTATRSSGAENSISTHCQRSSTVGADSRQLVQSPVGPPSAPMPQNTASGPTVGANWPPSGRTTSALPEPVTSTSVKCAQSGAVGNSSTFSRSRPQNDPPGAWKSVTRRNAVPLPSVCTRSTLPARRSRSTCKVPCLVSMPQSRLAAPPTGSASKSSQNSASVRAHGPRWCSGCRPPSGASGGAAAAGTARRADAAIVSTASLVVILVLVFVLLLVMAMRAPRRRGKCQDHATRRRRYRGANVKRLTERPRRPLVPTGPCAGLVVRSPDQPPPVRAVREQDQEPCRSTSGSPRAAVAQVLREGWPPTR